MNPVTSRPSWLPITIGALIFVFGLIATIWPVGVIVFLVRLLGLYLLIEGIITLVRSLKARNRQVRWKGPLIRGCIGIGIGALVLFAPAFTAATIGVIVMYIIAIIALYHGIIYLIRAFRREPLPGIISMGPSIGPADGPRYKWSFVAGGVILIALALLLFIAPLKSGALLVRIIGILAMIGGGGLAAFSIWYQNKKRI